MYRGRPWTIRQYAGFASAEETNAALPLPARARARPGSRSRSTCRPSSGYDSDDPRAPARSAAPASRSTRSPTWSCCFDGIPLDRVSTSMTINAPAALLLLLYELVAEEQGVAPDELRGTVQNDILKEYVARGNYIFPPRPVDAAHDRPLRLLRRADPALEHDLDLRVPHPRGGLDRGAGARVHARERDRLLPRRPSRGPRRRTTSASGSPSSSTPTTTSSRRWRSSGRRGGSGPGSCASGFGATNPKALALRFHAQTGGSTLTAQQPENNIVRVAIQALSAVCGGAQSLHTNSLRRGARAARPSTRRGSRSARSRSSPHEAGVDRHRRPARRLLLRRGADATSSRSARWSSSSESTSCGGAVAAIEAGFVQGRSRQAAYEWTSRRSRRASA